MRYFFAAGILATAEFAAHYPIQCCARLSGAPNLIMRVFSRKHDCTRWDAANWQPSCAIAGFLRTNSGVSAKHMLASTQAHLQACQSDPVFTLSPKTWTFGIGKRPRVGARKHACVKARKHETVLSRLRAVGTRSFLRAHERTRKACCRARVFASLLAMKL